MARYFGIKKFVYLAFCYFYAGSPVQDHHGQRCPEAGLQGK